MKKEDVIKKIKEIGIKEFPLDFLEWVMFEEIKEKTLIPDWVEKNKPKGKLSPIHNRLFNVLMKLYEDRELYKIEYIEDITDISKLRNSGIRCANLFNYLNEIK